MQLGMLPESPECYFSSSLLASVDTWEYSLKFGPSTLPLYIGRRKKTQVWERDGGVDPCSRRPGKSPIRLGLLSLGPMGMGCMDRKEFSGGPSWFESSVSPSMVSSTMTKKMTHIRLIEYLTLNRCFSDTAHRISTPCSLACFPSPLNAISPVHFWLALILGSIL